MSRCAPSEPRSGSPSSCSTTCWTSPARPQRTGKARGTDLLDGTVTLPLIAAAEIDPGIGCVDLSALDEEAAEALCDRIAATGALEEVRSRALELVAGAKQQLDSGAFEPEQRRLLELVADGVVQRYS